MNKKYAVNLSLTDRIWLLLGNSLELQSLGIARISFIQDGVEVDCGPGGTHKAIFKVQTNFKYSYEYYDKDTHAQYYCNEADALEALLTRLEREYNKLIEDAAKLQKQIYETKQKQTTNVP